ncbi:MAG: hypothetical protein H6837_07530 [Planctomycetes bacterium]|nr:hypothetical protein [Planctomycetota bacterium]
MIGRFRLGFANRTLGYRLPAKNRARVRPAAKRREGVDSRTVRSWRRLSDFPGGPRGPWDPDAVSAWAAARRRQSLSEAAKKREAARGHGLSARDPASLRYRAAKAAREELSLQRLRESLVERASVEQMLLARAADLRRAFRGLGRSLAGALQGRDPREVQQLIDERVARTLSDFVRARGLVD